MSAIAPTRALARRASAALLVSGLLVACAPAASSPTAAPQPAGSKVATKAAEIEPLSPRAKIKLQFAPTNITSLPLFLAMDKEYFSKAGLDVEYNPIRGSASTLLPQLARGDVDVVPGIPPAPALYNQLSEGFDIKVIASAGQEKEGRLSPVWLTVLKEKAAEIKTLEDLKGRSVEGGIQGSPVGLLAVEAVRQAKLEPGKDVNITYRARATADFLNFAQNKAADVISMSEPSATQIESQGLVVRWKSLAEVAPWFNPGLIAVSDKFLSGSPTAAAKFLEVYLLASREVNATNGEWTDELIQIATKWTEFETKAITDQGKAPYFEPNAAITRESLERAQQFWIDEGQVKQQVEVARLLDTSARDEALKRVGEAK